VYTPHTVADVNRSCLTARVRHVVVVVMVVAIVDR
jgi:hypothetical protein